jgi:hypothetical protein
MDFDKIANRIAFDVVKFVYDGVQTIDPVGKDVVIEVLRQINAKVMSWESDGSGRTILIVEPPAVSGSSRVINELTKMRGGSEGAEAEAVLQGYHFER